MPEVGLEVDAANIKIDVLEDNSPVLHLAGVEESKALTQYGGMIDAEKVSRRNQKEGDLERELTVAVSGEVIDDPGICVDGEGSTKAKRKLPDCRVEDVGE